MRIHNTLPKCLVALSSAVIFFAFSAQAQTTAPASTTLHYASNTHGHHDEAAADGFNLFDVAGSKNNPEAVNQKVNALPAGVKAVVWVGNMGNASKGKSCPPPAFSDEQFRAQVDALADNPRVFAYYVSDEPHPSVCPDAVEQIRARADYIHEKTKQKSFIIILDGDNLCPEGLGCEYEALAPDKTHVDLVGIDPYPCHYNSAGDAVPCDAKQIIRKTKVAISKGIPISAIVPVFQTFGQEERLDGKGGYYRSPDEDEMLEMLAAWHSIVPAPVMDYSYTYGTQCTTLRCPAPKALINLPRLRKVMSQHNHMLLSYD